MHFIPVLCIFFLCHTPPPNTFLLCCHLPFLLCSSTLSQVIFSRITHSCCTIYLPSVWYILLLCYSLFSWANAPLSCIDSPFTFATLPYSLHISVVLIIYEYLVCYCILLVLRCTSPHIPHIWYVFLWCSTPYSSFNFLLCYTPSSNYPWSCCAFIFLLFSLLPSRLFTITLCPTPIFPHIYSCCAAGHISPHIPGVL